MKKKILIMGSSGSIGRNTLEVIRRFPELFSVEGLAVNTNIDILLEQVAEFRPPVVVVRDQDAARNISPLLPAGTELLVGDKGLCTAAAAVEYDIFIGAMVGFAGLPPTIEAIRRGKRIGLANKETLVVAGKLVTDLCKKYNAELLPIDSEHSAIFQCMVGERREEIDKLILTASGGPFFQSTMSDLEKVTIQDALNHPTWKMGSKITIDSATLMNKGLEVIEAHWLFDFPKDRIDVVVHPQSIIHSMIAFRDGSIKAQLSTPDMKIPIQYALSYPERLPADYVTTDFPALHQLTFYKPDPQKFVCLELAYRVLETGGTTPCILNASNEVAVAKFLQGAIGFTKIPYIINKALDMIESKGSPSLEEIIECDKITRLTVEQMN